MAVLSKLLVLPVVIVKWTAAGQIDDRRDRPTIEHFLRDQVRSAEIFEVPHSGDHGIVAPVRIHRADFFLEAAAERAQSIVGGGEGIAQVAEVLRGHLSNCRLVRALHRMAPDIEATDGEVMRHLLGRRDLQGMIITGLIGNQQDVLPHGAGVDADRPGRARPNTGIVLAPVVDALR